MGPSPHEDGSEKVKPAVGVFGITTPLTRIVTDNSGFSSDFGKKFFPGLFPSVCRECRNPDKREITGPIRIVIFLVL